jgi:hypothetical protein
MSTDSKSEFVFVVYNPPRPDFPYLSVIFVPGREEPMVTAFPTAAQAETFNLQMAKKLTDHAQGT